MRYRLKRWWDIPTLWPICFSILSIMMLQILTMKGPSNCSVYLRPSARALLVYPNMLPVITAMLQQGLNSLLRNQDDPDSPLRDRSNGNDQPPGLTVPVVRLVVGQCSDQRVGSET